LHRCAAGKPEYGAAGAHGARATLAHADRRMACSLIEEEVSMSLTTILIIVLIVALLGGGGYYWRR
jgi:hypothetical protein